MPTPDGREWLSPRVIAEGYLWIALCVDFGDEPWFDHPRELDTGKVDSRADSPFKRRVINSLIRGYRATGYQQEFKLARMFEKVKDAALRGDLTGIEPEAAENLRQIFSEEFLDQIDEDGNLL